MGRRPKQSPERIQAILNSLRVGNTRRASAQAADISIATFYNWLEESSFLDAVEKAEAEAEQRFLGQVATAARTNWQAAAWWLERRKHADFGRRDRVDMAIDLRKQAEAMAQETGLDVDEIMREAEAVISGRS